MTSRLVLSLEIEERFALYKLAMQEFRDPRVQARIILRKELQRRGLLVCDEQEYPIKLEEKSEINTP